MSDGTYDEMSDPTRLMRTTAILLLALHPLMGCAVHSRDVPPLDAATRDRVGKLLVTMGPVQPTGSFGPLPASGSGVGAAAAAGYTVGGMTIAGASGGPLGLVVGGALGVLMAPFAAIIGAATTPDEVQPETLAANQHLTTAVRDGNWSQQLQDVVGARLSGLGASATTSMKAAEASHLGLWIEGPWLVLDGGSGIPTLTIHGEMILDEACVLDRRWRWNGDSDDFDDLGEEDAKIYKAQMASGISQLGNAIVSDLFLDRKPRKIAYKNAEAVARGAAPLIVTDPDDHQKQIGSWDKTAAELAQEPRCGMILALQQAVAQDAAEPVRPDTQPSDFPRMRDE